MIFKILSERLDQFARGFLRAESGAVTVDWVVLTAAITGLGLANAAAVRTGTSDLGGEISTVLSGASVAELGCLGAGSGPVGFECYTGPTIVAAAGGWAFGTGGGCWFDDQGNGGCGTPTITRVDNYTMSDGQTYSRRRVTSGGTTTTTWTNGAGETVDEPPPMT